MCSWNALQDEEAAKKREDFQFNRGSDDPPLTVNRGPRSTGVSTRTSRSNIDRTPSLDSDNLILVVGPFTGLVSIKTYACKAQKDMLDLGTICVEGGSHQSKCEAVLLKGMEW